MRACARQPNLISRISSAVVFIATTLVIIAPSLLVLLSLLIGISLLILSTLVVLTPSVFLRLVVSTLASFLIFPITRLLRRVGIALTLLVVAIILLFACLVSLMSLLFGSVVHVPTSLSLSIEPLSLRVFLLPTPLTSSLRLSAFVFECVALAIATLLNLRRLAFVLDARLPFAISGLGELAAPERFIFCASIISERWFCNEEAAT